MITHEILSKELRDRVPYFTVCFIQDQDKWLKTFVSYDLLNLQQQIQIEISTVEKAGLFFESISLGALDLTPLPLSQEELAKKTYFDLLQKMNTFQEEVRVGIRKDDDVAYTDLQAALKAAYKEEYDQR